MVDNGTMKMNCPTHDTGNVPILRLVVHGQSICLLGHHSFQNIVVYGARNSPQNYSTFLDLHTSGMTLRLLSPE